MKTNMIVILFLSLYITANAQSETRDSEFLFDQFTEGAVLFKNKTTTKALFNYDMLKHEMLFMDGEKRMILQELQTIDTIYINQRKFIPQRKVFLEKLESETKPIYVEWKVNVISKLKEEGMGLVSHGGGSDALNVSRTQSTGETTAAQNIDYSYKSNNTYYLPSGKKMQKFSTVPGFIKLYPKKHTSDIQRYISEKKINIQNIDELHTLIDYVENLNNE